MRRSGAIPAAILPCRKFEHKGDFPCRSISPWQATSACRRSACRWRTSAMPSGRTAGCGAARRRRRCTAGCWGLVTAAAVRLARRMNCCARSKTSVQSGALTAYWRTLTLPCGGTGWNFCSNSVNGSDAQESGSMCRRLSPCPAPVYCSALPSPAARWPICCAVPCSAAARRSWRWTCSGFAWTFPSPAPPARGARCGVRILPHCGGSIPIPSFSLRRSVRAILPILSVAKCIWCFLMMYRRCGASCSWAARAASAPHFLCIRRWTICCRDCFPSGRG